MKVAVRNEKGRIIRWEEASLGENMLVVDPRIGASIGPVAALPLAEEIELSGGKPEQGTALVGELPTVLVNAESGGKEVIGIERELKVIRVGPNPRLVSCEYWELESRRTCTVNVRNNKKWLKGMVIKLREPVREEDFNRPWLYLGKAPRRKGWW